MSETVLLVVDVQVEAARESVHAQEVIATVARLVADARTANVPVIWVQHEGEGMARGSEGWQIVPELIPTDGEPIVHKTWGDSFVETDLLERLHERGAKRIILCGAQTDACIRSTFYGGIHRGYDVTLVSDAHMTGDLRPYGAQYSPEQSVAVLNLQAAHTRQPGASGSVTTAGRAFSDSV